MSSMISMLCLVKQGKSFISSRSDTCTVNSEIFARVLFSRFMRSFEKIKPSRNGKITMSFNDIGKSCLSPVI